MALSTGAKVAIAGAVLAGGLVAISKLASASGPPAAANSVTVTNDNGYLFVNPNGGVVQAGTVLPQPFSGITTTGFFGQVSVNGTGYNTYTTNQPGVWLWQAVANGAISPSNSNPADYVSTQ